MKQEYRIIRAFICCLLLTAWQQSFAQPFPCDDRLYLVTSDNSGTSSTLTQVLINAETGKPEMRVVKQNIGIPLSGMGYNVFDGYIYGLNPVTYELIRMDVNGNITNLGIPNNMDKSLDYFAGTMSPNGRKLIMIGRTKDTGIDKRFLSIDVDRVYAGYLSIIADWQTQIEDIAYDPQFGVLMGFDKKTKRLVQVSIGGMVTSNNFVVDNQIGSLGALFFDAKGDLYAYGGSGGAETTFYKFDKRNGKVEEIGNGPSGGMTDGCSCPYRITFDKTVTPTEALPCSEVTYYYHSTNTAGTSFTQIEIHDTFPSDFIITDVSKIQIGEVASGVGTNILEVIQMHLLLGNNDIRVKVRVGSRPGKYTTQSDMSFFPVALGAIRKSDDPTDIVQESPTVLTIIKGNELITDSLLYLCPDETLQLKANISAESFLWNTGDTDKTLEVHTPGTYSVIATTTCGNFFDTVRVENLSEPLTVDLGNDQTIEQGDEVALNAKTNATGELHYAWQVNGDPNLSCTDCPNPIARPLVNAAYAVTITDANGCTASDDLAVEVIPVHNIFAPTAFSPNGDGINDVFYLQGKTDARIIYLRIFDRWGNLVFQLQNSYLNDANSGWDGKVYGKNVGSSTYVFLAELEFADGATKQISGEVALLR